MDLKLHWSTGREWSPNFRYAWVVIYRASRQRRAAKSGYAAKIEARPSGRVSRFLCRHRPQLGVATLPKKCQASGGSQRSSRVSATCCAPTNTYPLADTTQNQDNGGERLPRGLWWLRARHTSCSESLGDVAKTRRDRAKVRRKCGSSPP